MRCEKCKGRGEHPRKPNFSGSVYDAYLAGANDLVICKRCGGSGYTGMESVYRKLKFIAVNSSGEIKREAEAAMREFATVYPAPTPTAANAE